MPGDGTVLNTSVYEFPTRILVSEPQPFGLDLAEELPDVPAMPETLLAMELQLQERSVDLGEISEIILEDVGATVQILRLAGREFGDSEDRPARIEDCISALGLRACLRAAAGGAPVKGHRHRAFHEFRAHCREIGRLCRLLAEEMPEFASLHEAYLTGLLHDIGALPALLGWDRGDLPANRNLAALRMAEQWALPAFLKDFFYKASMPGRDAHLSTIVSTAHQIAAGSFAGTR
jgi:HD-like signal output (HDOD) protein